MTKVTERVLDLEGRLSETRIGVQPERAQFEGQKPSEPAVPAQPAPEVQRWVPQENMPPPPPPPPARTVQPELRAPQRQVRPRARRLRMNRSVMLALVAVMVIALSMVGVAVVTLQQHPSNSTTTTTTSCTMTAGGAGCNLGGSLYANRLDIAATPYNNSFVVIIVLTVNNTGSSPVTVNTLQFDTTTLHNGPLPSGGIGTGLWSSSSNPVANGGTAQFIINVPAASPSSLNGTHVVTLVDSSGTSYRLSVTLALQ